MVVKRISATSDDMNVLIGLLGLEAAGAFLVHAGDVEFVLTWGQDCGIHATPRGWRHLQVSVC